MSKNEKLYKIVAEYFSKEIEEINDQTDLIADLNAEEIDLDEVTLLIEDKFGIFIPERCTKVGEFVQFIP